MSEIISTTVQSKTKVKKIVVGTPIRRVTPSIYTQNIVDFDTTQKRDYDVLLYNADTDKYISSTLNFGNGLSATYNVDSAVYNVEIDLETVTGNLVGGQSVDFDSATGTISVSQNVDSTGNPYFNNLNLSGYLRGPAVFTIDPAAHDSNGGTVVIAGNLQVDGTTTTINSTTLTVDDKNITLAQGATDNASANGAGITVDGINAVIGYVGSTNSWYLNRDVVIDSNLTVQNNASIGNDLTVSGGILIGDSARIGNDLRVIGDTTLFAGLSVDDNVTIGDSAEIAGDLTVGGNAVVAGGFTADSLNGVYQGFDSDFSVAIRSSGSIIPDQNLTRTLGDENNRWAEIYVGGNTLYLGDLVIKDVLSSFSVQDSAGQTVSIDFDGNTTSDLTEGNNLYYTRARFDSALADNTSIESIRGYFSGAGDLTYDSATGTFSFDVEDVYTKANFDSDFNVALDEAAINGTGLTFDSATNTISLANTPVVAGVYGSTTQIPVFVIDNQGRVDSAGVVDVASLSGVSYNTSTGTITVTASNGDSFDASITLEPFSTSNLSEGNNLYYTTSRADSDTLSYLIANGYATQTYVDSNITIAINNVLDGAPAALDTLNELAEAINDDSNFAGTITGILATKFNIADFDSAFDARLDGKSTTDLDEGNNLYYTTARADSDFDTRLATKSTTDVAEGDNLYYTRARFDSDLSDSASIQTVRDMFSSGGDITYEPTTGEFSIDVEVVYTADNFDSDLDEAIAGGTGLNYNPVDNTVNIDSAELAAYFSTSNITEGDNLYYTKVRTDSDVNQGFVDRSTTNLSEGDNLYYTKSRVDSDVNQGFVDRTTTALEEGDNLYYTTARADSDAKNAISVTDNGGDGSLSYSAATGVLTYTGPSASEVRSHFSADGDISYDSATGRFSLDVEVAYTADNFDSDLDEAIAGGVGLNYNPVDNTVNIDSAELASYFSTNHITEGDNLYYTKVRVDSDVNQGFADRTTDDLAEGSNLYYTTARADSDFDTRLGTKSTTDLSEGNNLYYTKVRTDSDINQGFADRTTDDLSEGDNLYYTTARADSDAKNAVSASTGVTYNNTTGEIAIGQAVETTSNVTFAKVTGDSGSFNGITLNKVSSYSQEPGALFFDSNPLNGLSFKPITNEGVSDITVNIGQESLIYVHNLTGEQVNNGDAVYISGTAHGEHAQITKAQADTSTSGTIGLATMDIPNGAHGWVTRFGLVRDVNTGGMSAGADVYLSKDSAGKWSTTPVSIDEGYPYRIGKVIRVDSSTGSILVDPVTDHFESLRIEDKLRVTGPIVATGSIDAKTITFDGTDPGYIEGTLFYDSSNGALGFYNDEADITLQVGQENYTRVYNNSGTTIENGSVVRYSGADATTGLATIAKAQANSVEGTTFVAGVATHDIENGSIGYVTTFGSIGGINTSEFGLGAPIYLSPDSAGKVVGTAPSFPNYPMLIGGVLSQDSSDGRVFVKIENETPNELRVKNNARVDGNLTIAGNLDLLGTETVTQVSNLQVSNNFVYIGVGDTVITSFAGSGLSDASFKDYYTGDSAVQYNVEIIAADSAGAGGDTIKWYLDGDSAALGFDSANGPTSWSLGVDGSTDIPLRYNITIDFEATTGHDSGDRWYGDAAPTNVDLGLIGNYNTPNAPYTHAGVYRDASDQKFKVFNRYDPEVEGSVNTADSSFELATVVVNQLEISAGPNQTPGNIIGNVVGVADRAKLLDSAQTIAIAGDITATGVAFNGGSDITLNATIDSDVISNVNISAAAAIADTKLATISTTGKVQNSATSATDSNVGSSIVARDASGNFSAGTITADLVGDITGQVTDISNHNTDSLSEGLTNLYYTTARFDSDFGDNTTSDLSEGDNLYYTKVRVDSDVEQGFNDRTTTDLDEGNNLYYTKVRVDSDFDVRLTTKSTSDLSEGDNLYYTTARADSDAKNAISVVDNGGDGSLSYNSTTGEITYTGASASETRAHFSAAGDLSYDSATGVFSIDVEEIYTTDNFDSDFRVRLLDTTTDSIGEGSNLYYTKVRVDSDVEQGFNDRTTTDLDEGNNLYYTKVRVDSDFDARLAIKSTSNLVEGDNLYYTTLRADSDFDTRLSIKTTDDLSEGGNLYYTTARADSDIASYLTDNSFATQTYVDNSISAVLDNAPAALDTLNELAAAINDDSNFAGTVTANLATKLNISNFDSSFDTRLATKSTSNLAEGSNLYYTTTRFDSDFGDNTTSDLQEGDNLYYTSDRVDSDIIALVDSNYVANRVTIPTELGLLAGIDSGSVTLLSGNLEFVASEGIDVTVANSQVTITAEDASISNKGVASFDSDQFSVASGYVQLSVIDGGTF